MEKKKKNIKESDEEIILEEEEIAEENMALKIKKLRVELAECRKTRDDYLAGWQRAKADFINSKNAEERGRRDFIKFAETSILQDFLVLADSFEMSKKHEASAEFDAMHRQYLEILKKHGVEPIECEGKEFDPRYHEALENVKVSESDLDGKVTEELQKGFMLNGEILRPAKVRVGKLKD